MAVITRLSLADFRSYSSATVEPEPGFVLLYGENGAGKTNLLEAVSMLTPGRGLRGAALSEMARQDGSGSWAVVAKLDEVDIGTGTQASAPERRQVRINGAPASVNSLSEWLSVLWLTPAMDRLFTGSAADRRRFLDRLVLALEPAHAHHASRYEAAMRARNKLLAGEGWDDAWLASLELAMNAWCSTFILRQRLSWPRPAQPRRARSRNWSPRRPARFLSGLARPQRASPICER